MISKYHGVESRKSPGETKRVSAGEKFWTAIVIPGSNSRPIASIDLYYGKRPDIFFIHVWEA